MDRAEATRVGAAAARLRARRPKIHCLTNSVARAFTANTLLAIGAVPSMSADPEEVRAFVRGADALLINLGTLDAGMKAAIGAAVAEASGAGLPWVLDPVFADQSPWRAAYALELARMRPAALRLNEAEAAALGPDSLAEAEVRGTIVALSGETDRITQGGRSRSVAAGHPLMAQVTAMGCALGAVIAAYLATGDDPFESVAAAVAHFGRAGEAAGAEAQGPGTFQAFFLDHLHRPERGPFTGASRSP